MNAHVLLNLLNKLNCEVCQAFFLLFPNQFYTFNNTGA